MSPERPPEWADLTDDQAQLLEGLLKEHQDELERAALLEYLIAPGNEEAFLARYFPHRLSEKLEDFHLRLIDTALNTPRGLVLFPAGHGKTTIISCLLPILALIRDPNIRIVIVAKNDDEAAAIIQTIKAELTDNKQLIEDYGPFVPDPQSGKRWQATWIDCAKRTRIEKSPTIAGFGSGAKNILGHRSDWVICDDVVTEKNSSSPEQRQSMHTWFTTSVETSPQKFKDNHGRITVVGTMFHPQDLYASIQRKRKSDGTHVYAFHREDAIRNYEKEEVLWPQVWTWQDLMDLKFDIGTLSFNKRYRNMPVDESEQHFKEEFFRGLPPYKGCLDYNRKYGEYEDWWRIYQSLDPAVGRTKSAKFCGHIVAGVDPDRPDELNIIKIERAQLTVPQQANTVIDTALEYQNMMTSVVEVNAYQKGLEQVILDICERQGITLNVTGHTTGRNKQDPDIGVASLSPLCEFGRLRLPYGDDLARKKSEMLIQEMVEYPFYAYSDLLMALWMLWLKARVATNVYKASNYLDKKSPYRRRAHGRMYKNPFYDRTSHIIQSEDPDANV